MSHVQTWPTANFSLKDWLDFLRIVIFIVRLPPYSFPNLHTRPNQEGPRPPECGPSALFYPPLSRVVPHCTTDHKAHATDEVPKPDYEEYHEVKGWSECAKNTCIRTDVLDSLCHPISPSAGRYHTFCTSSISNADEMMNPQPPITNKGSHLC